MLGLPPLRTWRLPAWLLVAANLAPLYGLWALGWSAGPLLWFYWMENLVIGGFALLRMAAVPSAGSPLRLKSFLIPFFIFHYGMFCFVHGVFLGLIVELGDMRIEDVLHFSLVRRVPGIGWMLLALMISHGWSYAMHFLRGGERACATVQGEMARPYGRVVVMHLTVMTGGAALIFLDAPLSAAFGLLALKTLVDLRAHFRAHSGTGAPDAAII